MKDYTKTYFEQEISFFEVKPEPGVFIKAYSPDSLEAIQHMNHPEFDDCIKLFSSNWSFKNNKTGKRLGYSMEDGEWDVAPYPTPHWAGMSWDGVTLGFHRAPGVGIHADWVKASIPLIEAGKKNIFVDVSTIEKVAPRIALGQKGDGSLLWAWSPPRPDGLSFDQLAEIMKRENCYTAFGGDGGASVTAVLEDDILQGGGRALPDMLVVYVTKEWYKKNMEKVIPKKKVLLDCGHGGTDPGAVSPNGDREVDQNYGVMLELEKILLAHGLDVYTVGNPEHYVTLQQRVADEHTIKPDIFVSIHKNAYESTWNAVTGVETFCYKFGGNGEKLARLVQDSLIKETKMKNRHVKEADYYVVKNTLAPAILCELGFVTNITDAKQTNDPVWHKRYATGIAKGILQYFGMEYTVDDEPQDEVKDKSLLLEQIRQHLKSAELCLNEYEKEIGGIK